MRAPLLLVALLAAPALIPGAAGLAACLPPACLGGHLFGYNPPLAVVRAGEPVRWASLDGGLHTSTEGLTEAPASYCFDEFYSAAPGRAVTFAFAAGQLQANAGGEARPCTAAMALPGAALVPYYCRLHPTMHGALLVLA